MDPLLAVAQLALALVDPRGHIVDPLHHAVPLRAERRLARDVQLLARNPNLGEIDADLTHHPGVLRHFLHQPVPLGRDFRRLVEPGLGLHAGTLFTPTNGDQGEGEPRACRGDTAQTEHGAMLPGLTALVPRVA